MPFRVRGVCDGGRPTRRAFLAVAGAAVASAAGPRSVRAAALASGDADAWALGPFAKRKEPVLRPTPESRFTCPIRGKEVRWEEQNVYNPAAVVRDRKVHLLYRADDLSPDLGWGRTCRIGLATSEDGVRFTRRPAPVLYPDNDEWKKYEWEGGCEDLHIVEGEDGLYYMNYTTWSGKGDTLSIASSRDLVTWTKHGPAFRKAAPDKVAGSRSGVVVSRREGDRLIAAKIDGKYWMYYTHPCALAWSENLIDWTPVGKSVWGGSHEAGAIALLRDDGILLMTQGGHHALGAWVLYQALIDRKNLTTVLEERKEPFLYPEHAWEKQGMTGDTTVANGLVPFKGAWMLYYGGADRVIGLATCGKVE
jgi:beta-1,2-mannosidase